MASKLTKPSHSCFKTVREEIAGDIGQLVYVIGQREPKYVDMYANLLTEKLGGGSEVEMHLFYLRCAVNDLLKIADSNAEPAAPVDADGILMVREEESKPQS